MSFSKNIRHGRGHSVGCHADNAKSERLGNVGHTAILSSLRLSCRRSRRLGDAERIDDDDVLAQLTAGGGGDGIVLALEIQLEGRAGIVRQVSDDPAHTLAGVGDLIGRSG